jgi:ubiquinone/menaquinone biosynthesis C-methylase UbiE
MTSSPRVLTAAALALAFASTVSAQHSGMPAGMTHEQHMEQMKKDAEMKQHGNAAMGFDQDKTTHHFTMNPEGGAIAVSSNDPADQASLGQIRSHLQEIAVAFKQGDFGKPRATHSELPPGVPVMQRLKDAITYTYYETVGGGIVRIYTAQPEALAAIHEFISYQVREHKTGDPLTPPGASAAMAEHGHQQAATRNPAGGQADHFGRHFDNAADWVKTFDDPGRDRWQMPSRVIDALQLKQGQAVADVGAGTGYFSTRLARSAAAPTVYAVDIEPSMVAHLTERAKGEGLANMTAVLAGPNTTNLPEPVDVVLIVDTFHHIPNRVAYFTALKGKLKSGGRVAIVDFRKDAPQGPPVEFRFTPEQITAELGQAGFRLEASHDVLPQQLFLIYRVK